MKAKKSSNRKNLGESASSNSIIHTTTPLFGVSLSAEGIEERACIFVEKCLEFLHSKGLDNLQGLFRLCGSKTDIDNLRDQANLDIYQFQISSDQEPHSVAGLLKQYLRELPDPLVPFELYNHYIAVASINRIEHCPDLITKFVNMLPNTQRYLMGKLCRFLNEVQSYKASTLMSCENLATCIGPNIIRTADNDLRTMIADTPAIMSLFSVLIRDALVFFPDTDSLRPLIRKRAKSLSELNKQMFTIHLSDSEKKSVIHNAGEILFFVLEKICQTRGMLLETITVLDGNRNPLPSLYVALSSVEGRCVYLSISTEAKGKTSDLPRIKVPSEPKDEFIFPLPSCPMVDIQKSVLSDTHELKMTNRKSIGKSISSSIIPRALSPRPDAFNEFSSSTGHSPRDEGVPVPASAIYSLNLGKEEKRKSWKNQLTKRSSEINTKSLNPGHRTKSELQVPTLQTNNRSPLTQNSRAKSELQVPSLLSTNVVSNVEMPPNKLESKKSKSRSVKKAGKENTQL